MTALLELKRIKKSFPGVKALDGIDLAIQRGEVHALLGENGAGKSTLVKIMCGIYQPDEGDIFIDGQQCRFSNYRQAIEAGVGIIFQEFSLIPYMSAIDNIFLNREIKNRWGLLDRRAMRRRAEAIFKRLTVDIDLDCPVEQLSVAQQQFVEIAKALSLDARVLVLDEPTATLTPGEAEHLFSVMNDLRLLGVGMVFISHHLDEIFTICDRITVLRDGSYIETLATGDTNVEELVRLMVGRKIENAFPLKQHPVDTSTLLLEAEIQREKHGATDRFRLHKGEILGFAGLVGSGRTETVSALIGASRCHRKRVSLGGRPAALNSPAQALAQGIGLLPESRKTEGLVLPFSVAQNITLNRHHRRGKIFVSASKDRDVVQRLIHAVGVKTPGADTAVSTLSGGNQQKVVIARWLNNDCNILIFDEPTRGIDVGAKAEIYQLMQQLTQQGISIIMISSELPEIIGVCDRVLVFRGGHIVAELTGDDIESNHIMLHATGSAL
ncbi:sugar ABC transporter ATP-binding protein [Serratia sp. AKBS12]|uniref:sugar ABC transporter ATP-binding protein n=1 Tax=Serratia sp. AKBS12 TaxID=2974597 RepID=UPI0021662012|nr:sugar ABC transporter ATP-binding protein [Serratia sp. AKBS12]MCS3405811.1 sugar ABC transporter ATP-binding protein [Serratia sp. AKBS12]HEI8866742.1 sugar ABC transporter ATP-binding protein [Serratia odorifera]